MGPEDLAQVLRHLPKSQPDARVLVGLDDPDDAGVYQLTDDLAIVQTVDFFTPIVDDGYAFGQIAAANALSDVYAMGGKPITALNLVGYPVSKLPHAVLAEILRGGADKVKEAGAVLLGGHSIDDPEPKYGLSVTGLVDPKRVMTKAGARPGQDLILTKPIGTGTISTAMKRGIVPQDEVDEVTAVMARLNSYIEPILASGVRCVTDITGFGLLGHAQEVARESHVGVRVFAAEVPVIEAARKYAAQDIFPGGSRNNLKYVSPGVSFPQGMPDHERLLLCDAVTSGGLLIAVDKGETESLRRGLLEAGAPVAAVIGETVKDDSGFIEVV